MFDLINEIGQTMRNNKLRTGLTGFAVAWGIFMLIILLGLSRGLMSGFEEQSGKRNINTSMCGAVLPRCPTKAITKAVRSS